MGFVLNLIFSSRFGGFGHAGFEPRKLYASLARLACMQAVADAEVAGVDNANGELSPLRPVTNMPPACVVGAPRPPATLRASSNTHVHAHAGTSQALQVGSKNFYDHWDAKKINSAFWAGATGMAAFGYSAADVAQTLQRLCAVSASRQDPGLQARRVVYVPPFLCFVYGNAYGSTSTLRKQHQLIGLPAHVCMNVIVGATATVAGASCCKKMATHCSTFALLLFCALCRNDFIPQVVASVAGNGYGEVSGVELEHLKDCMRILIWCTRMIRCSILSQLAIPMMQAIYSYIEAVVISCGAPDSFDVYEVASSVNLIWKSNI
eukprot:6059308-Amphidinium_carterae.1